MAFEKLTNSIKDLNENVRDIANSSTEYYKLDLYKKIIKGVISLVNMMLLGFISLIAFFFLSMALAVGIGDGMDNPGLGFLIVGAFYVIIFGIIWKFGKKPIEKIVLLKSSRNFFND